MPLASPRPTAPRPARRSRSLDRETTLRIVVEDLADMAAMVEGEREEPLPHFTPARLHLVPPPPADEADVDEFCDDQTARLIDTRLGLDPADLAPAEPAAPLIAPRPARIEVEAAAVAQPESEEVRDAAVRLEMARAEAEMLAARVDAETANRASLEQSLAAAQDELRFLRNELQMVGQPVRPSSSGGLRRLVRALTGRRRAVIPATPSKRRR